MAVENVNTIVGAESDDTIEGTDQKDEIWSLGGNDYIDAGAGDDYIDAGEGDDYIDAGTGNNEVYGASGNDEIISGSGNDILWGDAKQSIHIEAPIEGIENSFDAVERSYDYLVTSQESTLVSQGNSFNATESSTNALNPTGITVIGASEGDAVKSWVNTGKTNSLNAKIDYTDKGYGVSNKNGNNGGQTSAIEGNESILFGLGEVSSADFTISPFDSSQTLTGQWVAYNKDRSVVDQGDLTSESKITINSPYVEFDAHKAGGRGSENAFYVMPKPAPIDVVESSGVVNSEQSTQGAQTEDAIETQVYGEHASTPPTMEENTGEIRLYFNNLNLSEGDRITLQVDGSYQFQGVVEDDGLDVLLASLGNQIVDEGLFGGVSVDSGVLTLKGLSNGYDMASVEVTLEAPLYNDLIKAGAGNDKVYGGLGDDKLYGGVGDDELYGSGQYDKLFGEEGDDRLYGGAHDDELYGGDGADRLNGEGGDDILKGEKGNDTLYGLTGVDSLYGGDGADSLFGGVGDDYLDGGDGVDKLNGGDGKDVLKGGLGDDLLLGAIGNDELFGDVNPIVGPESSLGGADRLYGGDGNDILNGGSGHDVLYGVTGADQLFGDGGDDKLYGGLGNDNLDGGDGADRLNGEDGDDVLKGGADTLKGGDGNDALKGNRGKDVFVLDGLGDDRILDFKVGEDKIDLTDVSSGFTELDDSGVDQLFGSIDNLAISSIGKRETQITYEDSGNDGTVTLVGVRLGNLSVSDFIFSENTDTSSIV